jgi:hypothetical protein
VYRDTGVPSGKVPNDDSLIEGCCSTVSVVEVSEELSGVRLQEAIAKMEPMTNNKRRIFIFMAMGL